MRREVFHQQPLGGGDVGIFDLIARDALGLRDGVEQRRPLVQRNHAKVAIRIRQARDAAVLSDRSHWCVLMKARQSLMEGIPARPPERVHFSAAAAAANAMASARRGQRRSQGHRRRGRRRRRPSCRRRKQDRRRGRCRRPFSYQLTPSPPRVTATTRQLNRASLFSDASSADPAKAASAGSEKIGVIGERQQALEHLGVGDIAIEHGRNAQRTRLAEQRDGAFDPARIGQHRRRLRDFIERQPIGRFRKGPAKIHDLPLAGAVDDDARDRGASVRKQSEICDVDSFGGERRAHFAPRGVIAGAAPERDGAAEPRTGHGGVRRHSAAERRIFQAPDLLALSGKKPVDAPDLIERGEPEADDPDLPGLRRDIRDRALVRASLQHPAVGAVEQMGFARLRAKAERSPTFGRSDGSTRAIAEAPARSKWISVSEPSGSTSLIVTAMPSAGSAATAKCSGRIPSTPLPALAQRAATLRAERHRRAALAKTPRPPRAIRRGRNSSPASR